VGGTRNVVVETLDFKNRIFRNLLRRLDARFTVNPNDAFFDELVCVSTRAGEASCCECGIQSLLGQCELRDNLGTGVDVITLKTTAQLVVQGGVSLSALVERLRLYEGKTRDEFTAVCRSRGFIHGIQNTALERIR
jgi:hypothetical protein